MAGPRRRTSTGAESSTLLQRDVDARFVPTAHLPKVVQVPPLRGWGVEHVDFAGRAVAVVAKGYRMVVTWEGHAASICRAVGVGNCDVREVRCRENRGSDCIASCLFSGVRQALFARDVHMFFDLFSNFVPTACAEGLHDIRPVVLMTSSCSQCAKTASMLQGQSAAHVRDAFHDTAFVRFRRRLAVVGPGKLLPCQSGS